MPHSRIGQRHRRGERKIDREYSGSIPVPKQRPPVSLWQGLTGKIGQERRRSIKQCDTQHPHRADAHTKCRGDEAHSARQFEGTEERGSQRRRVDRRTQVVPITGKGDLGGAQTATGRKRPLHHLHREAGTREKNRGREAVGPRPDHIDIDHGAPCPISFTSPTAYTGTTHQPVRLTRDRSLS